jgi:hypothetical protein
MAGRTHPVRVGRVKFRVATYQPVTLSTGLAVGGVIHRSVASFLATVTNSFHVLIRCCCPPFLKRVL